MACVSVLWLKKEETGIYEVDFSHKFCRSMCRKWIADSMPDAVWNDFRENGTIGGILENSKSDFFMVVLDPEVLIAPCAFKNLFSLCGHGEYDIAVPVYNTTHQPLQQAELPAVYLNVTSYLEVADIVAQRRKISELSLKDVDPCVLVCSRRFLKGIGMDRPLASFFQAEVAALSKDISYSGEQKYAGWNLCEKIVAGVHHGAFVHAFGDYYSGERDDLVQLVPDTVGTVLDAGCAMGFYGKRLKRLRPDISITGIEMNPVMAEAAKKFYDRILVSKIEDAGIEDKFDLVNCGDIIEHLYDPWETLKKFAGFLKSGGFLVMSVPNAGHWTIVKDLLKGKFQYIPVGLLCASHIRWFTEESLKEALADAGFTIDVFERQKFPPTPGGVKFINDVCSSGYGNRQALETNEFVLRAKFV